MSLDDWKQRAERAEAEVERLLKELDETHDRADSYQLAYEFWKPLADELAEAIINAPVYGDDERGRIALDKWEEARRG